jgi:hypothetical protein
MSNPINVKISKPNPIGVSVSSFGFTKMENILNLDLSGKKDGSVILYDESSNKWIATNLLDKQSVEAGEF